MSPEYRIHLDPLCGPLQKIDINRLDAENESWFNQTLCEVNKSVVRLGILDGDFHWHKHDNEDEYFQVLTGHLVIDVEDSEPIDLQPGEAVVMPKGRTHRPRALGRTIVLMVEQAGIVPTGD